jgi:hypothetical protein
VLWGLNKWKDFNVLTTPVSRPGPSKCTPRNIDPTGGSQDACLRFQRGRCWEKTTNGTDPACSVAFCATCLTLLRASDKADSHPTAPRTRPVG